MAGIDFNKAAIDIRERFALTESAAASLLVAVKERLGVKGCAVINTCNRMELWVSFEGETEESPFGMLCNFFGANPENYEEFFTQRKGDEAINHLFELSCGLKSMVFGEEQILTQVKDAISFSREQSAADPILEALFRFAVTAAKKAKTKVRLIAVDRSVAGTMVKLLIEQFGSLKGVPSLVIGSGEMGRLAVSELLAQGAEVCMTLRQYKHGLATIPAHCRVVDYEERYEQLKKSKIIISATRSPHCTLYADKVKEYAEGEEKVLFDLAVPRDIDPKTAELEGIKLFDIDDLGARMVSESENEGVAEVKEIIREEIAEFERWNLVRGIMPKINEISDFVLSDLNERLKSSFKGSEMDEESRALVSKAAEDAVSKVIVKFILSLQKDMDSEIFEKSFLSLAQNGEEPPAPCANTESPPPRFPLYVDLSGREVAIIGAGNIALRRIKSLLSFPCRLKVVAPEALSEIKTWADEKKLTLELKEYESKDIENSALVIAATDLREVNAAVAADARKTAKPCSIADNRDECTFYFPSIIEYDGGVIGVCGTGENHGRTKEIATDIREFLRVREEE